MSSSQHALARVTTAAVLIAWALVVLGPFGAACALLGAACTLGGRHGW